MKSLLDWRSYVSFALFAAGVLALLRGFGDHEEPMSRIQWFVQFFLSVSVAAIFLYAHYRFLKYCDKDKENYQKSDEGDTEL